jgi:hypothetical protein
MSTEQSNPYDGGGRMMSAARPTAAAPVRQEWNTRWIVILVATALLAGAVGYLAGGGTSRSTASVLTGDAYAGVGQISALATDGITYAIPVDQLNWLDSRGSMHSNGRAECLPPELKTGKVKFAAVRWTAAGFGGYSVVLVDCRS